MSSPSKLFLDVEQDFEAIRDKAQDLLWPENQDDARWADVTARYTQQAGMPCLPPKGLETLKKASRVTEGYGRTWGMAMSPRSRRRKRLRCNLSLSLRLTIIGFMKMSKYTFFVKKVYLLLVMEIAKIMIFP
ncbi:MAG: hypothetical protein LH613_18150 [Chamaesiphon sp.]|nr:hypothetical protein [Chamaesiphon sp.]